MKKESGLTIVELLAAISILFIIGSVIYGVFTGVNKNYHQISSRVNLEQEANIIINTIKTYHQKQNTYLLSYNPITKKAYIGTTSATIQLEPDNIDIVIKINDEDFSGLGTINSSIPLDITITLVSNQGQSYDINTIIKRY
jgi:tRNA threonylcarbamoyladenosine modification (KEOPS) complex  Pcc1 subunit